MTPEDYQPGDRRRGQADREPDERRADEPGDRFDDGVAGRDDQRDQDPDHAAAPKIAEVGEAVAGIHAERV